VIASERRLTVVELEFDSPVARGLREYVRLVAAALGLRGPCWLVQLEPPANVYIALDDRLPLHPTRDIALVWDEEHGWSLGVESNRDEDLLVLGYLGEDVLPEPDAVARAVRRFFAGQPAQSRPPAFRATDDHELPARLAGYVVPPADGPRHVTVPYVSAELF
jgi:hypothetical protein